MRGGIGNQVFPVRYITLRERGKPSALRVIMAVCIYPFIVLQRRIAIQNTNFDETGNFHFARKYQPAWTRKPGTQVPLSSRGSLLISEGAYSSKGFLV